MKILVAIHSVVDSWCIPDANVEWLRREFPDHTIVHTTSSEATQAAVADVEVVFSAQVSAAALSAARRLRWIHSPAAGVGSMLFPEMIASDVLMTNSRGTSAITIAEHTIAVTLALLRNLPLAWQRQRERVWAQDEFNSGTSIETLHGKRMLIVGLGAIGSTTAALAHAFGADVVGVRRHTDRPLPAGVSAVVPPSALHEQLPLADVIVLSAPQTAATTHLIGAGELSRLKPQAVLVNVSRGKLVDEPALLAALEGGALRGAALDVFEHEPLPQVSALWDRRDVLITPHVSGFHATFWRDVTALFAENLRRFTARQPLLNPVDKSDGY